VGSGEGFFHPMLGHDLILPVPAITARLLGLSVFHLGRQLAAWIGIGEFLRCLAFLAGLVFVAPCPFSLCFTYWWHIMPIVSEDQDNE
jgi:hypothetical protein